MKKRLIAVIVLTSVLSAPLVQSEEKVSSWYEKITMGGELRFRNENMFQYGALTGGTDNDSVIFLRARPHLEAIPVEGLRVFIQPQFSRIFAQEESTIANTTDDAGGVNANANNVFDLHQGYIDFEKIAGSRVSLRVGRQELAYGDERLVGAFGWSNIGRSFDAGKLRVAWDQFWIDGFLSWNERAGAGDEYFGGLYSSWKTNPTQTLDIYSLLLRDNNGDGSATITGRTLLTTGSRLAGTCREGTIDYNLEAAIQAGKTSPNTHFAYAGHIASGYNFDTSYKPRLGVEYNFASGDDPTTARVERFNNLFPTNHDKYGFIDFVGWQNIHDIMASASVKPGKGVLVKLDYHLFLLPEVTDGIFRASGAQLRAGVAGASMVAGHEIDLLAKYQWNKWAQFLGGYSVFKGGKFFSDTGANGTAHFAYLQTTVSF